MASHHFSCCNHGVPEDLPLYNHKRRLLLLICWENVSTTGVTVLQTNGGETVLDMKSWLVYQGAAWRVQRAGLI